MIALIISLPICSSSVFARLYNPRIKGTGGIEGYVKEGDTISLSIGADIEGDDDLTSQIRLADLSGDEFTSCDGRYCYDMDSLHYLYPQDNEFSIDVSLYKDDATRDETIPIRGTKDIIGPEIKKFSVDKDIAKDEITFTYEIEDKAFEGSDGKCSGIWFLSLTSGGKYTHRIDIDTPAGECTHEGSHEELIDDISNTNYGEITVEAIAYDVFKHQSSTSTVSFIIDKEGPEIKEDTFRIFDNNNNEIEYLAKEIKASVSIEVKDPSEIQSVNADFSGLKESNGIMPANLIEGNQIEGKYEWVNVFIDIGESETVDIKIDAIDSLGNVEDITVPYSFSIDDESSTAKEIRTERTDADGNSYIGKDDNKIIVEIEEDGIGFGDKNIYLDLAEINGNEKVQADECAGENGIWECTWNIEEVTAADKPCEIRITPDSSDDLGNKFPAESLKATLIVDRTGPVIGDISYTPANPTSENDVEFSFNVIDNSPVMPKVSSFVGSSPPISSADSHEGSCTEGVCTVIMDQIISSHVEGTARITAEDAAGNSAYKDIPVIIYKPESETPPEFVSIRQEEGIKVVPATVDKKVAAQIDINVFVHVPLTIISPGEIIDMAADCEDSLPYLKEGEDIDVINAYGNDPYIPLKIDSGTVATMEGNSVPIICELRLTIKDDDEVYTLKEIQDIETELPLYGNILGDMGSNLNDKIASINNDITKVEKDIDEWERWVEIFGTYCELSRTMGQLNRAFQALKATGFIILGWLYDAFKNSTLFSFIAAIAWAVWVALCTISNYISGTTEGFFWPMGAPTVFSGWKALGWVLKISCMVFYNCAICDMDELIDLGGEFVQLKQSNIKSMKLSEWDWHLGTNQNEGGLPIEIEMPEWTPNWVTDGERTQMMSQSGGNFIFNPYKSIHYAYTCMCLPAIIYNLKKLRQIRCMYKNCLINHVGSGQSSIVCDLAYKERECLYYESAQYLEHGEDVREVLNGVVSALLKYLESLAFGTIIAAVCSGEVMIGVNTKDCKGPPGMTDASGMKSAACGVLQGVVGMTEINDVFSSKFGQSKKWELQGEDYCTTGNY
ncbi:hypothetical protein KY358_01075 [Candidatus Woesearchaeota archaeon]|nr:hypothetical protein [Candidatus Woesearchaeota archaeon]